MHRFTDFLVYEVNEDSEVVHVKSLEMPHSERKKEKVEPPEDQAADTADPEAGGSAVDVVHTEAQVGTASGESSTIQTSTKPVDEDVGWTSQFDETLGPYLTEPVIAQLRQLFEEGPEPPFVSDSGWAGRQVKVADSSLDNPTSEAPSESHAEAEDGDLEKPGNSRGNKRGRGRGRDRGGSRGGRGRGGGGRGGVGRVDNRKVISDVRSPHDDALSFRFSHKPICFLSLPFP